jgi:hypothetical protein
MPCLPCRGRGGRAVTDLDPAQHSHIVPHRAGSNVRPKLKPLSCALEPRDETAIPAEKGLTMQRSDLITFRHSAIESRLIGHQTGVQLAEERSRISQGILSGSRDDT